MLEVYTDIRNHNSDCSDKFMPLMGSADPPSPQAVAYTDVNIVPEHDNQGSELMISRLQEISSLREKQRSLDGKRGEALNKILDIKGSIRVFCRVRPSPPTNNRKIVQPISTEPEKITVRSAGTRREFAFDRVFPHEATQDDVFLEVEPIIRSALDGHNVCIFAYGQTGTGKTFTMEGTNDQPGIVPRALEQLFHRASLEKSTSLTFSMSMLEVYMGNVRDLLASKQHSTCHMGSGPKCSLNILSSSNGSVEIEGLTDEAIRDLKQANRFYARGKRSRSTSWTNVNEASSRSHCLTRISIGRRLGDIGETSAASKLWLVDLGGSERLLKTGATGQTLDEGKAINLSLSALGDVIAALKRKRNHIPYRNSKLTQILRDSLGDGSKALMLVHVSLSQNDVGESICSLSFAKRVRDIEPNRELSEDSKKQKEKRIKEFEQKIDDYEEQLREVKNQIEKLETLVEENKKLLPYGYQLHEDQKGSARSFLAVDCQDVKDSPRTADKSMYKAHPCSVPRFMTSTVCSRQRKGAAVEVVNSRLRTFRLQNSDSLDFTGSQSIGYFYPDLKPKLQILKSKLVSCETNISKQTREVSRLRNQQDPSCNSTDSISCSFSTNRRISTPQPNFRVPMHQHRRRMSALT